MRSNLLSTIGIIIFSFIGSALAAEPPVVIFDTDFALPAMPNGEGSGTPVCIDELSGLLVAGCDGAVGPEGPEGPQGEPGIGCSLTPCMERGFAVLTCGDSSVNVPCVANYGCPSEMARVDDFCIDRWEARLVAQSPYEVPTEGTAVSENHVVPQGYISQEVAKTACQNAGKRLCTTLEWRSACQGTDGWTYPYGNTYQEGACNDYRAEHPLTTLYGPGNENWSDLDNPQLNQLSDTVDLTGQNTLCVTPEGVYDLVGNLNEWVDDPNGTFLGGFYVEAYINGEGCLYQTTAHNTYHHDFSTGFRCCLDP